MKQLARQVPYEMVQKMYEQAQKRANRSGYAKGVLDTLEYLNGQQALAPLSQHFDPAPGQGALNLGSVKTDGKGS